MLPSNALPLDQAGYALRQVLLRLNQYATNQASRADPATRHGAATLAHLTDLQALLAAVEQYEEAALASLAPTPVDVMSLTATQLIAYREADPVYRLGWVRGHKAGSAQAQRTTTPVLIAYAQHATLPPPTTPPPTTHTDLVHRVRAFLAQITQRQQANISTRHRSESALLYGND
jgi:hypothetical protein